MQKTVLSYSAAVNSCSAPLHLDVREIEKEAASRTKAIVVVRFGGEAVSLPVAPNLTDRDVDDVINAVRSVVRIK